MEKIASLYIVMPIELYAVPIPMTRMQYTDEKENIQHYSAAQVWPNARKSVDGKQVIISFSPDNFETELIELQQFPHRELIKLLSYTEAKELMQTKEWQAEEEVSG